MGDSLPVEFNVRYRLGEYLCFVRAHVFSMPELKDCSKIQKVLSNVVLSIVSSVAYFYKSFRVGTCHFSIDKVGITRWSKGGRVAYIPWADVIGVHKYNVGYLIQKHRGAMPVPFRVLSDPQQASLLALVSPYLKAT